jgi:hypothetical protein
MTLTSTLPSGWVSDTLFRVRHHGGREKLEPLALELLARLHDLHGWDVRSSRGGANSLSIRKGNRQLHFRGRAGKGIEVYNRYRLGNLVATLRTRTEVARFIEALA